MSWFTRFLALRNGRGIVAWWRVFSSLLCVRVSERLLVCYEFIVSLIGQIELFCVIFSAVSGRVARY